MSYFSLNKVDFTRQILLLSVLGCLSPSLSVVCTVTVVCRNPFPTLFRFKMPAVVARLDVYFIVPCCNHYHPRRP